MVKKGEKIAKRNQEEIYQERKQKITRQFKLLLKTVKKNRVYFTKFGDIDVIDKMASELSATAESFRSLNVSEDVDLFE